MNEYAFPAYLVHMPVLTVIGVLTDKWRIGPVKKALVVGSASVVGSWVVGAAASKAWQSIVQERRKRL